MSRDVYIPGLFYWEYVVVIGPQEMADRSGAEGSYLSLDNDAGE